jgi:hypothetical protein
LYIVTGVPVDFRFVAALFALALSSSASAFPMFSVCPDQTELRMGEDAGEACWLPDGTPGIWLHSEEYVLIRVPAVGEPSIDLFGLGHSCVTVDEIFVRELRFCVGMADYEAPVLEGAFCPAW